MICLSVQGKSNIFALANKYINEDVLIIADGAAFGSEMEKMVRLVQENKKIKLYLPESFEWLILSSGLIEDNSVMDIISHPERLIESREYFSWERYFTEQLIQLTQGSYLKYAKRQLNPVYLQEKIMYKVLAVMKGIKFDTKFIE